MAKPKSVVFEFVCQQLEKNKDAEYATVRAAAEAEGYTIYPIMYGRAKAKLGLVEVRPRGARKREQEERARRLRAVALGDDAGELGAANGAVRPSSATSEGAELPLNSLEAVIHAMKSGDAQRERYRKALRQIHAIIEETLAH